MNELITKCCLVISMPLVPNLSFSVTSQSDKGEEPVFTEESIKKMEEELAPGSIFESQYLTYTVDEQETIIPMHSYEGAKYRRYA